METQGINTPASNRQLAYIEKLRAELGLDDYGISDDINSFEASTLISELVTKAQEIKARINELRLMLAMKECFKSYIKGGWDIWHNKYNKASFIKEVIDTYWLFTEIAERIQERSGGDKNRNGLVCKCGMS